MTTLYFPSLQKYNTTVEKNDNKPISEKITEAISNVTFRITSILDIHGKNILGEIKSEFGIQNEGDIHEFLKNYQNTFPIFEKSILIAKEEAIKGNKVSAEIYIHDLSNPEIVQIMKNIKDSGVNSELIVLDIKKDDYGIFNSVTISNLKKIAQLGFPFSIDGFSINENTLTANHLENLISNNVYPSYIKITKNIYESIISRSIKLSKGVINLLGIIKQKGIKLLAKDQTEDYAFSKEPSVIEIPDFLKKMSIKNEDMLSINGDLYGQEGLVSFGNGINTIDGLKILKEKNLTGELMKIMLVNAVKGVAIGKKRSINIYLKDLGKSNLIKILQELSASIPMIYRENLIFEILEDTYGSINDQVIKNLKLIQKLGFSIAIDDLYFGCDKNSMSKEILETIHEEGIIPKYLKIDGRHSMGIKDGTIPANELGYIREIIGQYSKLHIAPIFIIEWIQDTEHAKQIIETINLPSIHLIFQGRNISYGNFGTKGNM